MNSAKESDQPRGSGVPPLPGWISKTYVHYKGKKLGPYYVRHGKVNGKLKTQYIKPKDLERTRAACQAHREYKQLQLANTSKLYTIIANINYLNRMAKRSEKSELSPQDKAHLDRIASLGPSAPNRPKLRLPKAPLPAGEGGARPSIQNPKSKIQNRPKLSSPKAPLHAGEGGRGPGEGVDARIGNRQLAIQNPRCLRVKSDLRNATDNPFLRYADFESTASGSIENRQSKIDNFMYPPKDKSHPTRSPSISSFASRNEEIKAERRNKMLKEIWREEQLKRETPEEKWMRWRSEPKPQRLKEPGVPLPTYISEELVADTATKLAQSVAAAAFRREQKNSEACPK